MSPCLSTSFALSHLPLSLSLSPSTQLDVLLFLRKDLVRARAAEKRGEAAIHEKSIANEIVVLDKQAVELRQENKTLVRLNKRYKRDLAEFEHRERAHQSKMEAVRVRMHNTRTDVQQLDNGNAEEERKFNVKLRAEQEMCLQLERKLKTAKAHANDPTPQFLLSRKVVDKETEWQDEKNAMLERVERLQGQLQKQEDAMKTDLRVAVQQLKKLKSKAEQVQEATDAALKSLSISKGATEAVREQLRDRGLYVSEDVAPCKSDQKVASAEAERIAFYASRTPLGSSSDEDSSDDDESPGEVSENVSALEKSTSAMTASASMVDTVGSSLSGTMDTEASGVAAEVSTEDCNPPAAACAAPTALVATSASSAAERSGAMNGTAASSVKGGTGVGLGATTKTQAGLDNTTASSVKGATGVGLGATTRTTAALDDTTASSVKGATGVGLGATTRTTAALDNTTASSVKGATGVGLDASAKLAASNSLSATSATSTTSGDAEDRNPTPPSRPPSVSGPTPRTKKLMNATGGSTKDDQVRDASAV